MTLVYDRRNQLLSVNDLVLSIDKSLSIHVFGKIIRIDDAAIIHVMTAQNSLRILAFYNPYTDNKMANLIKIDNDFLDEAMRMKLLFSN